MKPVYLIVRQIGGKSSRKGIKKTSISKHTHDLFERINSTDFTIQQGLTIPVIFHNRGRDVGLRLQDLNVQAKDGDHEDRSIRDAIKNILAVFLMAVVQQEATN